MKNLLALATIALLSPILVYSQDEAITIPTRFGELKANSEGILHFGGQPISPDFGWFVGDEVVGTYKLDVSDVVLIHQPGGTSCPGRFVFITVSQQGAKVTPHFGTCYDDDVKPEQAGQTISFSMKKIGGKGLARYVYKQGSVLENGRPVR